MKTFRRWNKKYIADWGAYNSDDSKAFYRAFKNYLKRTFPSAELIGFKPNHYDFSGFIKFDGITIYISHDIDRSRQYVDFEDTGCSHGVLFRTAENEKDYHGGPNHFSSIFCLENEIKKLISFEERRNSYDREKSA